MSLAQTSAALSRRIRVCLYFFKIKPNPKKQKQMMTCFFFCFGNQNEKTDNKLSFPIPVRSIGKSTKQITVDCPLLVFQFQARRLTRRVSTTSMRHFFFFFFKFHVRCRKVSQKFKKIKMSPKSGIGKTIYRLFFILVDDESLFFCFFVFFDFHCILKNEWTDDTWIQKPPSCPSHLDGNY